MKKIRDAGIPSVFFVMWLTLPHALAVSSVGSGLEHDTNRPGMDYKTMSVNSVDVCAEACKLDPQCRAFSVEKPQNLQTAPLPVCRLKNGIPAKTADKRFISGLKGQNQVQGSSDHAPGAKTDLPTITLPAKQSVPNISTAKDGRTCPETITVKNLEIQPANVSPVPGFAAAGVGNPPLPFKYLRRGMTSPTLCYCEYELGGGPATLGLLVRLRVDLAGYSRCGLGNIPAPGGGTTQGFLMYK